MGQISAVDGPHSARDLPSLTSLRAFAALLVFLYHLGPNLLPHGANEGGYAGVAFFYVLSGFVLTWGGGTRGNPRQFYVRRLARIYPAHLLVWLVVLLLPVTPGGESVVVAVINGSLLQAWVPSLSVAYSMNGVTWSLSCEVAFYALFPVLAMVLGRVSLRSAWFIAAGAFVVTSAFVLWAAPQSATGTAFAMANVFPIVRLPEFLLGIVAALTLRSGRQIRWYLLAAVVLLAGLGASLFHEKPDLDVWVTPVVVVGVMLIAQADAVGKALLGQRFLVYAGKVSFSFYLVHQLVIRNVVQGGPLYAQAALAFGVSVVIAITLHHLVETPAHRWVVARLGGRRTQTASDPVGS